MLFRPRGHRWNNRPPARPSINRGSMQADQLVFWAPFNRPDLHQVRNIAEGTYDTGSAGWEARSSSGLAMDGPEVYGAYITGPTWRASVPTTGPYTFAAWTRPEFDSTDATTYGLFQRTTGSVYLAFTYSNGSWSTISSGGTSDVYSTVTAFAANDLVHVACTYVPGVGGVWYQNGVQLTTDYTGTAAQTGINPGIWQVGYSDFGPSAYLGSFQDVRFYHRAMHAGEVYQLYDQATRWELYQPAPRLWIPGIDTGGGSPVTATPSTLALSLATFAPTVTVTDHQTVTPSTASLSLSAFAPTVTASDHQTVTPSTAGLSLSTFAPTVTASDHQTVTPSTASLSLSTFATTVSVTEHVVVTPTTATLTLTTYAPEIGVPLTVTPTTAALSLTTFAPTVTASDHQVVTPGVLALALTPFVPTVTASDHQVTTPSTLALILSTFAPTVTTTAHQTVTPSTLALSLSTFAPTVTATGDAVVTPGVLALALTAYAPTVSVSGGTRRRIQVSCLQ